MAWEIIIPIIIVLALIILAYKISKFVFKVAVTVIFIGILLLIGTLMFTGYEMKQFSEDFATEEKLVLLYDDGDLIDGFIIEELEDKVEAQTVSEDDLKEYDTLKKKGDYEELKEAHGALIIIDLAWLEENIPDEDFEFEDDRFGVPEKDERIKLLRSDDALNEYTGNDTFATDRDVKANLLSGTVGAAMKHGGYAELQRAMEDGDFIIEPTPPAFKGLSKVPTKVLEKVD